MRFHYAYEEKQRTTLWVSPRKGKFKKEEWGMLFSNNNNSKKIFLKHLV